MEQGGGADEIRAGLQRQAAGGLGVLQLVDRGEMVIGERRVGERPQMLGGLEFGRVGRKKQEVDMIGHAQALGAVPPSPIQHEHDLFGGACSHLTRERGEFGLKEGDAHRGRQMEERATRRRMDEAHQVAPLIAVLDRSQRAVAIETPHFVQNRLQPDAMFVGGPELDDAVGESARDLVEERADLFLKASCSAASACTWRGRGLRRLPASLTR